MMDVFFNLLTGEKLSVESLLYYLPGLKRRAAVDVPQGLFRGDTIYPADCLGVLNAHLARLHQLVTSPLAKAETPAERRKQLDVEVLWFTGKLADGARLSVADALAPLGLSPRDMQGLLASYLHDGDITCPHDLEVVVAAEILSVEQLFDDIVATQVSGASAATIQTLRTWVQREQYLPLGVMPGPGRAPGEAYALVRRRLRAVRLFRQAVGKANPDWCAYVSKQLLPRAA